MINRVKYTNSMGLFSESLLLYLIGSIPFGPIICFAYNLKPPNTYGSQNIGATNVARQHPLAGVLTFVFDFLKSFRISIKIKNKNVKIHNNSAALLSNSLK